MRTARKWTRGIIATGFSGLLLQPIDAEESVHGGASCAFIGAFEPLNLAQAVDSALENQPQLLSARADVSASQAGVAAARSPFLPTGQAGFDAERFVPANGAAPVTVIGNNVVGGTQTYSSYASLNLNWNIYNSGRDWA